MREIEVGELRDSPTAVATLATSRYETGVSRALGVTWLEAKLVKDRTHSPL